MGRTVNEITINRSYDQVFEMTNNIQDWTSLFNEYDKVEILEQRQNYIKFRLTKKPDKHGNKKSWTSERFLDKTNKIIHARRIDPLYPFQFMNITWEYEEYDKSTRMIWIQEFLVDPQCPMSEEQMETYLNNSSVEEMRSIKTAIEEKI